MNAVMARLIGARVAVCVLSLLIVSGLVFIATSLLPGDVTQEILGQSATPEAVEGLRRALNLDRPAPVRYLEWLGGLLTGDPGISLVNRLPVAEMIASRLPNSLLLAGMAAAFCVPAALFLGITSAIWRGSAYDRVVNTATVTTVSVPEFLVATLAVLIFAVHLRWLPAMSYASKIESVGQLLRSFALPVATLSCVVMAQMTRMTRAALLTVLDTPYIEMAVLKGARPMRVVLLHALPNAVGPIANAVAFSLSYLVGGAIIVEIIFSYPGIARLMVDAVATRDMPLVQACAMIFSAAYLVLVLVADLCAILSNPRLRYR
ncbi:MAG: ABC transporter permease [Alphaproteobacteria bacterium]|nr:ABC transporter permease [Alphaproteobacteria bacterium]